MVLWWYFWLFFSVTCCFDLFFVVLICFLLLFVVNIISDRKCVEV